MLKKELLEILEEQKSRVSEEIYNKLKVLIECEILQNQFILNVCIAKDQLIHNLEDEYNNILWAEAVEGTQEAPQEDNKTFVPSFNYTEAVEDPTDPIDQEQQDPQDQEQQDPKDPIDQLKEEIRQEAQQQKEDINNMAEAVKPEKGNIKNENYDLPINTHPDNMTNKNINYDLIGALTLHSYFGGNFINHNGERYFYKNNLDLEKIGELIGKTERATKRFFDKLIKSDTNIIKVDNTKNGIVYTLNCKTDGKFYTTINHKQLYQLLVNLKPDLLKLYLVIKYKCKDSKDPVKLTREYLASKIGLSTTSRNNLTKISSHTNLLETLSFIKKYNVAENIWDEEKQKQITKTFTYYSICTYEQWALRNPREAKLKQNKETKEYYFSEGEE